MMVMTMKVGNDDDSDDDDSGCHAPDCQELT